MDSIEALLKRDRQLVTAVLVIVVVAAWAYTLAGVGMGMSAFEMTPSPLPGAGMEDQSPMAMPAMKMQVHIIALVLMWWLMMVAMMLPSAAPTILLAAAINRRSNQETPPYGSAAWFTAGYLLIWLLFSVIATLLQLWLESTGYLGQMMHSSSRYLSAVLLILAGVWQFTPIKQACLRHCRSPVHYLTAYRRSGDLGAFRMGVGHGTFCLGCCWFLMALLFVGGIMNVYWIAGLALFVLLEKTVSGGEWFGKFTGVALILSGLVVAIL